MTCDEESNYWGGLRKPKPLTLSEMIQKRRDEGREYIAGELRECLVQREMARHKITEEQALAEILAFRCLEKT